MAHQKQVISWIEELVPEIKRTRDPESTMLKFAADKNLSPAQLEKLAQVYNTAKTINFLEKSANRGDRFHVVDAEALVAKYASVNPEPSGVRSDVNEWCFKEAASSLSRFPVVQEKVASAPEPSSPTTAVRQHIANKEAFHRNIQAHEELVFNARLDASEKLAKVVDIFRSDSFLDFSRAERDALYVNPAVKEACDLVAAKLTRWGQVKRATDAGSRRLIGEGAHAHLLELQERLDVSREAGKMHADFMKEASNALGYDVTTRGANSLENQNPKPPKKKEDDKSKSDGKFGDKSNGGSAASGKADAGEDDPLGLVQLIRDVRMPNMSPDPAGLVGSMMADVMSGRRNKDQEALDSSADDNQAVNVVTKLMFTDPIISQAEPSEVLSLANSIRKFSPAMANDENAMRAELREKLQFGSLPGMAVKEYSGIQKTISDEADTAGAMKRDRYSVSGTKTLGGGKA